MKLAVLIPVHTHPYVAKLTIGSLIRTHGEAHDLNIHVGVHTNYVHYCKDLSLFDDLRGIAQVHPVDEIDWGYYDKIWYRYSVMHAANLVNLWKAAQYYTFDYALVLDHDVHIKVDFTQLAMGHFPGADIICAPWEKGLELGYFETAHDGAFMSLPKVSGWHMLFSRRMFDWVNGRLDLIYPTVLEGEEEARARRFYPNDPKIPIFADTLSRVLHHCRFEEPIPIGMFKATEFAQWIQHFSATSFNFGEWQLEGDYQKHLDNIQRIYEEEFPNGLPTLKERGK